MGSSHVACSRVFFARAAIHISLGVLFFILPRSLLAGTDMTLVKRETLPLSEGRTIIRSHYLYQSPALDGVQRESTTLTKELIVVGCGVNYDANRGVGEPKWVPSHAALALSTTPGAAFESTASPLEVYLPEASALYRRSLFPSHEAYREGCTSRATIYCASMADAILCALYKRWTMGQGCSAAFNLTYWPWTVSCEPVRCRGGRPGFAFAHGEYPSWSGSDDETCPGDGVSKVFQFTTHGNSLFFRN